MYDFRRCRARGGARAVSSTAIAVVAVALLAGLVIPAPAGAAAGGGRLEIDMSDGAGFTLHPHGALIDTTRLAPGRTATGTMGIRNGSGEPADLSLQVVNVSDHENGCTRAELLVDPGCGPGAGDIGRELIFGLAVSATRTGTFVPSWSGSAAQLQDEVVVSRAIPARTARWVRMTVALPMSSGNTTETDTFGFNIRVMLQTSFGVEGIQIGGGGPGSSRSSGTHAPLSLAFTGAQLGYLVTAAALLILAGLVLAVDVTRMRKRTRR